MENEAAKSLVIRLSVLKTKLDLNWQQLASEMGISRQTLTTAKVSGRLNDNATAKVIELERQCGISHNDSQTTRSHVRESQAEYLTDKEINLYISENKRLIKQVDHLQTSLKATQDNLTSVTGSLVEVLKLISSQNKVENAKKKGDKK